MTREDFGGIPALGIGHFMATALSSSSPQAMALGPALSPCGVYITHSLFWSKGTVWSFPAHPTLSRLFLPLTIWVIFTLLRSCVPRCKLLWYQISECAGSFSFPIPCISSLISSYSNAFGDVLRSRFVPMVSIYCMWQLIQVTFEQSLASYL
jgi:hypothetical protein